MLAGGFPLTTNLCGKPESLHRLTAVPLPLTREAYFLHFFGFVLYNNPVKYRRTMSRAVPADLRRTRSRSPLPAWYSRTMQSSP